MNKKLLKQFITKLAKAKIPNIVADVFDQSIFHPNNKSKLSQTKPGTSQYKEMPFSNTLEVSNGQLQGTPSKPTTGTYTYNRTFNTTNTNSNPTDFPGLQGMPTPDPSNYLHISTGTGQGGEIISRPQVKFSSLASSLLGLKDVKYTGRNKEEDEDDLIPPYYDPYREKRDRILKAIEYVNPYNPVYYMGKMTKGPISGLGAGVSTGALMGILPGIAYNWMRKSPGSYTNAALAGAGIGAAILGTLGMMTGYDKVNASNISKALNKYSSEKKAFAMPPNDFAIRQMLQSKIMADMSLDYAQKTSLANYVQNLNPQAINQLSPLAKGLIGSGIGAAIANKLLGLGYTGTILFGILGGLIGANVNKPTPPSPNFIANYGFRDINGNLI